MRNFRYIIALCVVLAGSCYVAEPVAYAQTTQIVKGVSKKVGKIFGKKAGKEAAEGVGKKASKEAAEAAGKKAAKEGFQEISKELTEKAIKENSEKLLVKNARNEVSERTLKEVGSRQVKTAFSNNVAKSVGKDAVKIFKDKAVNLIVKSGDDAGAEFAKKLGTTEAKETLEHTAKQSLKHSQGVKSAEKQGIKKRVEKGILSSKIKKTALYKELQAILKNGPITLSDKEFRELLANPKYLREYILVKTGDKKNFQEFFIRLAMGNKEQAAAIMDIPWVKEYLNKAIRSGGVHEWLMTKNFRDFLLNPKWGEDGPFLALALTKFVQKTRNIKFKVGGGHVASGISNSTASIEWHKKLAEVISKCGSKEEIFVEIRKFAKETLTDESYREFCQIFASVFKAAA